MECDGLPSLLQEQSREHSNKYFVPITHELFVLLLIFPHRYRHEQSLSKFATFPVMIATASRRTPYSRQKFSENFRIFPSPHLQTRRRPCKIQGINQSRREAKDRDAFRSFVNAGGIVHPKTFLLRSISWLKLT